MDGLCIQAQGHQSRQGEGQGATDQRRAAAQQRGHKQRLPHKKVQRLLLLPDKGPAGVLLRHKHHHLPQLLCDSAAGARGVHPLRQDRHVHVPGHAERRGADAHRLWRQALLHLERLPERQPTKGVFKGHRHVLHLGRARPDLRHMGRCQRHQSTPGVQGDRELDDVPRAALRGDLAVLYGVHAQVVL